MTPAFCQLFTGVCIRHAGGWAEELRGFCIVADLAAYNGVFQTRRKELSMGNTNHWKAVEGMRFVRMEIKPGQKKYLTLFCVGLVAGFFMINIGKSILLEDAGLFDEHTLYQMKYMTVDSNALFYYVLRKRILRMLVLAVMGTTYLGLLVCMGTALWYGMSAGVFLTALALRYGVKGIGLAVLFVFPQYLIYVPVALALLFWCESIFRGIYIRKGERGQWDRGAMFRKAGQLLAICGAAAVGCLLESYVNPFLLMGFLKVF